jgi:hypothetical protein
MEQQQGCRQVALGLMTSEIMPEIRINHVNGGGYR